MHVLDEGVSIMVYFLQRYSTQNYLECVGRLQDHSDTLEDIRRDLQTKGPLAEDIDGLHCQLEEVQVCHLYNIKPLSSLHRNSLDSQTLYSSCLPVPSFCMVICAVVYCLFLLFCRSSSQFLHFVLHLLPHCL